LSSQINADEDSSWVVLKFGGASVKDLHCWTNIHQILSERLEEPARPLLVCSAVSGVTNRLEALVETASNGGSFYTVLDELLARHQTFANDLNIEANDLLTERFSRLETLARRLAKGERHPKLRAEIVGTGEVLSTSMGARYLQARGMRVRWMDARDLLDATTGSGRDERLYLSASCSFEADHALRERLDACEEDVIVTQGFIARGPQGDTALLGRGGSDTSAAYLAAKLGARRLEIWTDVPGVFSANPKAVPGARLVRQLTYEEAERLASAGGKVLHPRCVRPVNRAGVPILIKCTAAPHLPGTEIAAFEPLSDFPTMVKAVSSCSGLYALSLDLEGEQGSMATLEKATGFFRRQDIDLKSLQYSESRLHAIIDPSMNQLSEAAAAEAFSELESFTRVEMETGAASVSLIGAGLHGSLERISPVLSSFPQEGLRQLGGEVDPSMSFLVDGHTADDMVMALHEELFDPGFSCPVFGAAWDAIAPEIARAAAARQTQPEKESEPELALV